MCLVPIRITNYLESTSKFEPIFFQRETRTMNTDLILLANKSSDVMCQIHSSYAFAICLLIRHVRFGKMYTVILNSKSHVSLSHSARFCSQWAKKCGKKSNYFGTV